MGMLGGVLLNLLVLLVPVSLNAAVVPGWNRGADGSWYYYETSGGQKKTGWLEEKGSWYWLKADGKMAASEWIFYDKNWYWLKADGRMASAEWITYDNNRYYLKSWGGMMTGFQTIDGKKYYFRSWGGVYRNAQFTIDGKTYRAKEDGSLCTGIYEENGTYWCYDSGGVLFTGTGWIKIGSNWYWCEGKGKAATSSWIKSKGLWYWLKADGKMAASEWICDKGLWYWLKADGAMAASEWILYDKNRYYLDASGKMLTGWQEIDGDTYYFLNWGGMVSGDCTIDGKQYSFGADGKLLNESQSNVAIPQIGVKTVRNYLANAMLPVGNTLYIWGGGHDDADATRNGMNPGWQNFFNSQDASYNYANHRYEYGKGLDCSGYVGWVSYQVMQKYATTTSTETPGYYQNKGWGTCKTNDTSMKFVPGDIVAMQGHVWIVLGQCEDGSVVILHASPQYVQISGTVSTSGDRNSEAIQLADYYMKKYFPVAFQRYGTKVLSKSYMTGIRHFSWSDAVLSDPEDYRSKKAPEILKDLLGE